MPLSPNKESRKSPKQLDTTIPCGFFVTPKYPVGTRFLKSFAGYEGTFEGRITGFDGEYYDIYYPQDGDSETLEEKDLEHVQIVYNPSRTQHQQHKRPSKQRDAASNGDTSSSHGDNELMRVPSCTICTEFFSGDPSDKRSSARLPMQGTKCAHVLCADCLEKIRITASGPNAKKLRAWIDCPICKTPKSFHADHPTVCLTMCDMVRLCQNFKQQKLVEQAKQSSPPKKSSTNQRKASTLSDAHGSSRATPEKRHTHLAGKYDRHQHSKGHQEKKRPRRDSIKRGGGGAKEKSPKKLRFVDTNNQREDTAVVPVETTSSAPSPVRSMENSDKNPKHMACSTCHKVKGREKFTTKQWERGIQFNYQKRVHCRRCEEKAIIQREVGATLIKFCTRVHVKTGDRKQNEAKFLSTVLPWPTTATPSSFLPSEITLDGYTREDWSLADNTADGAWQTAHLRCIVGKDKVNGFLDFLRKREKSAYGTFLLDQHGGGFEGGSSTSTDGFICIPFDQPSTAEAPPIKDVNDESSNVVLIFCKYVLGLGLIGGDPAEGEEETGPQKVLEEQDGEDYVSTSHLLGSLLASQVKTETSLSLIPRNSVKAAARTAGLCPVRANAPRGGVKDWFRTRIEIQDDDTETCIESPDEVVSQPY